MSGKWTVDSGQYKTGAASLFASIARQKPDVVKTDTAIVPCPICRSEDTVMVDHDMQIYQCRNCGETFDRPPG